MLTLRTCVVGVVAVLLVGGLASAQTPTSSPCPSGQELREEYGFRNMSEGCGGPDGEREGLWTQWHDANGQKSFEATYLNGTETSVTAWDENGTQTSR